MKDLNIMPLRALPEDPNIHHWLDRQPLKMEAQACLRYALAFNTLDASWLHGTLSPFVTYDSQSIGSNPASVPPRGHRAVMNHWSSKIEALRRSGSRRPAFELAVSATSRPCAAGFQPAGHHDRNWLTRPVVNVTLETDALGMIRSVFLITVVPDPAHCLRSGIFPGLEASLREVPRNVIRPHSDYRGLTFVAFLLNGEINLDHQIVEAVAAAALRFPGSESQCLKVGELTDEQAAVLDRVQFVGFPSVAVFFREECILRHQGVISTASLVSQVARAMPLHVAASSSDP